ncbi:MAG: DUF3616 domain-containing protein [Bauldia sp.]
MTIVDAFTYRGLANASAAVALSGDRFAVADDERSVLTVFRRGVAEAVASLPLGEFLGLGDRTESDLEGAAAIDGSVYWITSHGLGNDGRIDDARLRLFATRIARSGKTDILKPVGSPYRWLRDDLLAEPRLARYDFLAAARSPPRQGGIDIEGLASTPKGHLRLGFRSPLSKGLRGKALLVDIANPGAVIAGKERAVFGGIVKLDLGNRGIRSIESVKGGYVVAAGPVDRSGDFALYRWSGRSGDPPEPLEIDLGDLKPEALFAAAGGKRLVVLSDDGRREGADGKAFRSIEIEL